MEKRSRSHGRSMVSSIGYRPKTGRSPICLRPMADPVQVFPQGLEGEPMKRGAPYKGDTLTPDERSERMGRVRGKNTKPELVVRQLLHSMGYRYRLHRSDLPGNPDIVFPSRRKAIFVHGCFWHRHDGCPNNRTPKSRLDFWVPKLESNRQRDLRNQELLASSGWEYLVVWECELRDKKQLANRLRTFLNPENQGHAVS